MDQVFIRGGLHVLPARCECLLQRVQINRPAIQFLLPRLERQFLFGQFFELGFHRLLVGRQRRCGFFAETDLVDWLNFHRCRGCIGRVEVFRLGMVAGERLARDRKAAGQETDGGAYREQKSERQENVGSAFIKCFHRASLPDAERLFA